MRVAFMWPIFLVEIFNWGLTDPENFAPTIKAAFSAEGLRNLL